MGGDRTAGGDQPGAGGAPPSSQAAGREVPHGQMAGDQTPAGSRAGMNPGDEVPPDAPGAGENICRACGGSGRVDGGRCESCGGTGKVIEAVSGGP